jgi:hypothetical protein
VDDVRCPTCPTGVEDHLAARWRSRRELGDRVKERLERSLSLAFIATMSASTGQGVRCVSARNAPALPVATMTSPTTLLHPERVAAATIRGYLTQAYYAVQCWLDLAPGEVLICEGNEDIDRLLLNGDGLPVKVQQQQIKDLTQSIPS